MTTHSSAVSVKDLAAALRAYAAGCWHLEAATELFIRDYTFLCRGDFRQYIDAANGEDGLRARVDWKRVAHDLDARAIPASGGELRNLRVMTQLADVDGLGGALSGTDTPSVGLILHGTARAAGWHQTLRSPAPYFLVTGKFDTAPPPETVPRNSRVAVKKPTFQQSRAQARRLVGDAGDAMIGDWVGEDLATWQMTALRKYQKAIAAAKAALDEASA